LSHKENSVNYIV